LASTRDTLNLYIKKIEKNCIIKKNNTTHINLNFFFLENNEIQIKIFNNCIKTISKNYYPPRAKKVLNLLSRVRSNEKIKATLGGCLISRHKKNLIISKEELKKATKL